MAIKDVFKGFFVYEDEEEVVYEENTPKKAVEHVEKEKKDIKTPERKFAKQSTVYRPKPETVQTKSKVNERKVAQNNVVNIHETPSTGMSKVCLFEPRVFSDTQDIADELKNRRATLVNLQRIDKISAKRIIDFLSGTVYAIGGDIQRIGVDIFLCTPDNVEVAGSITEMLEAPEDYKEREEF
ncbi:cell division protein SepF [Macrococcoides caseolyticum]|uniref:cell division protein SepF n=1 Tax=Macrococcoides caseolyticum TaxID=69966 RepID=UPI001F34BBE6|nr:cell division protein SepF [Macrococcus caseolyticus]MCE4956865.1 cell division protein SepF [Macrococcus caseolyticus]